ncbi:bifunctional DNA primase/polymerase [Frankia sp. R43]|uniref:bifunctional DNA primase/polymerase n=1 Tax=Frankia sp. R43 TaxID=269536 RepID=UPI0006CA2C3E|nr:bifunctional DNA primase/polymerase [Frankia sp. R43]
MGAALLGAALRYARLDWPVVPLEPRGKRPILPDWTNTASTDPDVIRRWWARRPDANVGIVTGPRSGLAVLDLDPRSGGAESLAELETRVGALPGTAVVVTGSDGIHFYYRRPGAKVTSRAHSFGSGLDVKADGGQVVAPPSIHPNGQRYAWCGDVSGLLAGDIAGFLAPWPAGQLAPADPAVPPVVRLTEHRVERERRTGSRDPLVGLVDVVLRAREGDRNNALHWAACRAGEHIAAGRLGDLVAADALLTAGRQVGLLDREVAATITSGMRRGLETPR